MFRRTTQGARHLAVRAKLKYTTTGTMSLISVDKNEFAVGQPLRWTLYDHERNVLMEKGQLVENEQQLRVLLARNPLRELAWNSSGERTASDDRAVDDNQPEQVSVDTASSTFTFHDMRLRAGDRLQLQPPAALGTERYIVRLIGYLENASLLVTAPISNGLRLPIREKDTVVARVFTSQKAFGFDCQVERVCKIPYEYLHLSFPRTIQGAVIRKSPRIRTKIIVSITSSAAEKGSPKHSGVIVNLSADGALVKTREPLGEKSQLVTMHFRVNLHNMDAYLTTRAVIRSILMEDDKDGMELFPYHHGVQFLDLAPNDSVILQSLIYQQMIEHPEMLA